MRSGPSFRGSTSHSPHRLAVSPRDKKAPRGRGSHLVHGVSTTYFDESLGVHAINHFSTLSTASPKPRGNHPPPRCPWLLDQGLIAPQRGLLCSRRERPHRRTTEPRDELSRRRESRRPRRRASARASPASIEAARVRNMKTKAMDLPTLRGAACMIR
jgi:hypothetical protein